MCGREWGRGGRFFEAGRLLTYWSATGLLSDELFLKFTDSLLSDWVLVFVLNATDIDCDVQVVERVIVGHGLKARGGIYTYNCSWAVKWVETDN